MLPLARSGSGGVSSYSRLGDQDSYGSTGSSRFEVEREDGRISNWRRAFRTGLIGTLCFVLVAVAMMSWMGGAVPPAKPATQQEDVKEQPKQANLAVGGGAPITGEQAAPEEHLTSSYSYELEVVSYDTEVVSYDTEKSDEPAVSPKKSNDDTTSTKLSSYSYELQQVVSYDLEKTSYNVEEDRSYSLGKSSRTVGSTMSKEASSYNVEAEEEASSYDLEAEEVSYHV
mmetsp:Transcript_26834/g.46195  ORF Transcript_26834/g.46195 Transcript_26834/m.46195 type:complete len:228 (+) Transcript_26834:92-775(+)